MRTQPQDIIKQLEAHNSRLDKEEILYGAMEEGLDEFFEGVTMALDPLVTFGVKQVPEKAENEAADALHNARVTLQRRFISRQSS